LEMALRQKMGPLVMFLSGNSGNILVKTRPGKLPQFLASLKQQWESFSPPAPFSYSFLDDRFKQVYIGEQKIEQVLTLFSGLTIFIACLGLFGLATFTAEQRTKEIGVRKVLGASKNNAHTMFPRPAFGDSQNLLGLFNKSDLKLAQIGSIIVPRSPQEM